jgi:uncharacterized membrane protein YbhN (UPF0104 family)
VTVDPSDATQVIEDGVVEPRLRRPLDLVRFVIALAIAGVTLLIAYFATSTTAGLDSDIASGVQNLPGPLVLVLNVIGGIGTLGLPIAAAVALILRKRLRQLFDALVAMLVTVVVLTATSSLISAYGSDQLMAALAGSPSPNSVSTAPILGGLIAFVTVSRLMTRRPWNVLSIAVIGSVIAVTVISSSIALAGIGFSLAIGWALGLLTRYVVGTPTTRPNGYEIAATLDINGYPLTTLRAVTTTKQGRRYIATTRSGGLLRVTVLDRDLEGAGLISWLWTAARLRNEPGAGTFNLRRSLDHAALMAYASQAAGVAAPRLLVTAEIGPDSVLLAYEQIMGTTFDQIADLSDADLEAAWRAIRTMHEHDLSHRGLHASNLVRDLESNVWLVGNNGGSIAAGDVAKRIDLAELLVTLALLTDVERAVSTGRTVLGNTGLVRALPVLQKVALSSATRKALRKQRKLLVNLRDALVEMRPDADVEQIQLQRIKPRTLIMIIVGSIAGYVLLSQMASVDLATLLTSANWWWMGAALALSLITYVAAAWSLSGFVPEPLKLRRTVAAQVAGDFATLVSPPTLGAVAINLRFLQKAGLHPALAAASVGVSQVMAFVFHILLLFAFGIAAGTQRDFTFNPPRILVIAVVAVAIIIMGLFAVPWVRQTIRKRLGPTLKEVGPRLVTVAQRPLKLLEGIGGILMLNLAYIGVLAACVYAFGGQLNIALIAVVYLAGATIGQAAPTPGGLGAVEAALSAGLTAAGLDGGTAVSAVLAYRLVTFWLPTVPGYWCFTWLTKKGAL